MLTRLVTRTHATIVLTLSLTTLPPSIPRAAASCASSAPVPHRGAVADLDAAGQPRLDRTRPVPSKSSLLEAWRKRQDAMRTFRFAWTEQQCHPTGWLANPRYPERERTATPALWKDRSFPVTKQLAVDGHSMRYGFDFDRAEEPDGIRVGESAAETRGLGVARHYSYLSVFDGQRGETRVSSRTDSPPAAVLKNEANVDAQNLDVRAFLLAFRPLDSVMGHRLIERAVTNERRTLLHGRSTFLLEERHDPSGWKTILWVEPERDFLVSRMALLFEQQWVVDMDIDYRRDSRWGWIPSGWRLIEMLADGTRRQTSAATVSSYAINEPIEAREFR